jgi:hypothetical protein
MFRIVFWHILPCKMKVDNHFTRQYIPEDNSEHHTRRRENLKSHENQHVYIPQPKYFYGGQIVKIAVAYVCSL